ncbi:hypothetical protein GLOIN_2v1790394 [Rhizophagus clarus]|uniref:Uncharacterized protein n=1 Tax=Rhizophagus clarus TaxID=94130 RepID=A0A8H3R6D4_9GLOM|nr:hypothetical protein GLOIN_2v1790394 [Rhizophagus clarus]
MIPILWSYPYKYVFKHESLLNIIISHLSDNTIKLLKDNNIISTNFQKQKLTFNYITFFKYLNCIHRIIPRGSTLLEEEIYKLFIRECSSIKCLNMYMLNYPIYKYPGADISLSNLYELTCDTDDQNFYHELAQICRSIEKIHLKFYLRKSVNKISGIEELIKMQKQIKYVYIKDYYECKRITQALEKHANSIIHLELETKTGYFLIPNLTNLQLLRIHRKYNYELNEIFKENIMNAGYYKLQILELQCISLELAINIIRNINGNLWKIKIRLANCDKAKEYNQTIYKYCPNIKYVTIFLNRDGTLEELENILIKCQSLKAIDIDEMILDKYRNDFLRLLIKSAPPSLYKLHINRDPIYFNKKILKLFFNSWSCKGNMYEKGNGITIGDGKRAARARFQVGSRLTARFGSEVWTDSD